MFCSNNSGKRVAFRPGPAVLCTAIVPYLAVFGTLPAAAAPFAYVSNPSVYGGGVSVIDTGAKPPAVVATVAGVGVGPNPAGVAVTPDGKHAYVANSTSNYVSVIDTVANNVAATIQFASTDYPLGLAITPDGAHVYVTRGYSNDVAVIATATNTVVMTITVGTDPVGVAITPDGNYAYVANYISKTVSVIATATNTVVATVAVGSGPWRIAISPDGRYGYVTNLLSNTVSLIATATNTVSATIAVGTQPGGIAVTPDGKHAYVANFGSNSVSVIDTASNTVVTTVPVGNEPLGVAIPPDGTRVYVAISSSNPVGAVSVIATASNTVVGTLPLGGPPPEYPVYPQEIGIIPDVPFAAFSPTAMINLGTAPNTDAFVLKSSFALGSSSHGINPLVQPVTFQIGTYAVTIPPGSFTGTITSSSFGPFFFNGTINGMSLHAVIAATGTNRFSFQAGSQNASLTGTVNPVTARVSIGVNSGTTSVTATISGTPPPAKAAMSR